MKTNFIPALLCSIIVFGSCKKEINRDQASLAIASNEKISATGAWQGFFSAANKEDVFVPDSVFIQNGYARLTANPYSKFTTTFKLEIPAEKFFNGDSLLLTVRVRNPDSVKGAVYPNDVSIIYDCAGDSIRMQFSALPEYAIIGSSRGSSWEEDFNRVLDNWTKLIIQSSENRYAGHVGGEQVHSVLGHYPFGRLERIVISFKGSGAIDWLKLEGLSGKLLMEENFDGPGSNVIWYE